MVMFDPIANKKADVLKSKYDSLVNKINNPNHKKFYEIRADKDFTVYLPLGGGEFGGYTFQKEPNDDFIKLMGLDVFYLDGFDFIEESDDYDDVIKGELNTNTPGNHFTTTINTEVSFEFTGTRVSMNHLVDNRGGMWEVYIDGVKYENISTYSEDIKEVSTLIADDLEPVNHLLILRFVGQDPLNPVENPRGWIYHDRKGKHSFDYVKAVPAENLSFTKKIEMIRPGSNIEYAITVANEEDTESEWIPEHNQIGTVFLGDESVQNLIVDGREVDMNTLKEPTPFKTCEIVQVLGCKLPSDDNYRTELILKMEFSDVMKQYFEMEFMQDSIIKAGFAFQMPMTGDFLGKIKTDKREILLANYETMGGGEITVAENVDVNSFTATSDNYPDFYLENVITNYSKPMERLYLQHRSTELQKLYPQFFFGGSGITVEKGYKLYFDGYYKIGRLKNSNKIYS